MKSNWLLIAESEDISLKSTFIKIPIGESKQEKKDFQKIRLYAIKHGYYFEKWDEKVSDFIYKIAKSLGCDMVDLNIQTYAARPFVKYIEAHGDAPKSSILSRSQLRFRQIIKPASYFISQINVIRHAEAKQRNKPKVQSKSPKGS